MKDLLFMAADVWMIFVGYIYGWRFIRQYDNYLLGVEWILVASAGTNYLLWALVSGSEHSPMFHLAGVLDAFTRSVGITLVLVLGMLGATHRYRPPVAIEVGAYVLGIPPALYLGRFLGAEFHVGPATFYIVVNLLASAFMMYVAKRLWSAGARRMAVWTGLITAAATAIAFMYDFFPLSFDDPNRTIFYTAALVTWGGQGFVYFHAYCALRSVNDAAADNVEQQAMAG
ncbi:transporter [Streptomyces luteogriseus]|uniref:transporter n=1 Tax=Streptomyces luteogriseus TaxID=68233 RepID=UPI00379AE8A6